MDKNNKIEAMMVMVMKQKAEMPEGVFDKQKEETAVNLKKRSRSLSSETETISHQGKATILLKV